MAMAAISQQTFVIPLGGGNPHEKQGRRNLWRGNTSVLTLTSFSPPITALAVGRHHPGTSVPSPKYPTMEADSHSAITHAHYMMSAPRAIPPQRPLQHKETQHNEIPPF